MRSHLDAPLVPILLGIAGLGILGMALIPPIEWSTSLLGSLIGGGFLLFSSLTFIHTSVWGKWHIWQRLLNSVSLPEAGKALDAGTGSGLVLFSLAQKMPKADITGIDLWRGRDQAGNSAETLEAEINRRQLSNRVHVKTANVLKLPFDDNTFDVVTASLLIHNLKPAKNRVAALTELARVLKPTGTLLITDMEGNGEDYANALTDLGFSNLSTVHSVGYSGWWGGPWLPTFVVQASRIGENPHAMEDDIQNLSREVFKRSMFL